MGAFTEAVRVFGAQNVAVIPTRADVPAMPLVKRPDKFGVPASKKLLENPRFGTANAAICPGSRSRLTIVDVDSADPAYLEEAIKIFGETPLKVGTPSGGLHLYYLYTGERRRIRPIEGLPLDILGAGGLAVVPPSIREACEKKAAGQYSVVEGDLTRLSALPAIKPAAVPRRAGQPTSASHLSMVSGLREGEGRDDALFATALRLALPCATEEELVRAILAENSKMAEPLSTAIAVGKAASAWRYKLEGKLFVRGSRVALGTQAELLKCIHYPPAWALLSYLKCNHVADREPFAVVPEALANVFGQNPKTVRKAREWLVHAGLLILHRKATPIAWARCTPNLYRFPR